MQRDHSNPLVMGPEEMFTGARRTLQTRVYLPRQCKPDQPLRGEQGVTTVSKSKLTYARYARVLMFYNPLQTREAAEKNV